MASQKEIYEILGTALAEPEFRQSLLQDPAKATAALGISLTEEQVAAFKEADLSHLSEGLDERLSKHIAGCPTRCYLLR